jgi:hypothetical protein
LLKPWNLDHTPRISREPLNKCSELGKENYLLEFIFSVSLGCTVNGESPKKIIEKIDQGQIDV